MFHVPLSGSPLPSSSLGVKVDLRTLPVANPYPNWLQPTEGDIDDAIAGRSWRERPSRRRGTSKVTSAQRKFHRK